MTERKTVKGIVTNGLNEKEYKQIYRQPTLEASVKKALDLGKFDTDFAEKLVKAMKSDPRTRKLIAFLYILGIYGGITKFTVDIAISRVIQTLLLSHM